MSFIISEPQAGGISSTVVDITSAELLDMYTNPIPLLPAPGAGKCISVDKIIMQYSFGGVAYTQPGNTNAVMNGNNIVQFGNILNAAGSFLRQGVPTSVVLSENAGLYLTNTNANLTSGDGTVRLFIYYNIHDLAV